MPRVGRNVLLLGLTSFFTDISSEMVTTVLPLYLVYSLGFTPLQFGLIDGLQQGAAALVRVAGGFAADRSRRHKEVASVGYGLSAVSRIGLLAAGSATTPLAGVILVDRVGKGIRTAPRDALISLSAPAGRLGSAFGVHRALDTAGAMVGPLLAVALLALAPQSFDTVFVVSFSMALVGLGILVLFVQNRRGPTEEADHRDGSPAEGEPPARITPRDVLGLLGVRRFRALVAVGAALGLTTISDAFLYLGLQQRADFDASLLPLLFVGTAAVYMVLAVPLGQLADRFGRLRVFLGGYALLLVVYSSLLLPSLGVPALVLYLVLFGAFYAATDGVLMALASAVLPAELRGSGLALLVTATSLARLLASVLFGLLWTWAGVQAAVLAFAAGLLVAAAAAAVLLVPRREALAHG